MTTQEKTSKRLRVKSADTLMLEANGLLLCYSAKVSAKKATKAAAISSTAALKIAALATRAAAKAAKFAAAATESAANITQLAQAAESAFHRADEAAADELPDEAQKWSVEATKFADAAAQATELALKTVKATTPQ